MSTAVFEIRKRVRKCARADTGRCPIHGLYNTQLVVPPAHIPNFGVPIVCSRRSRDAGKGYARARTFKCDIPLVCVKHIANVFRITPISAQSVRPFPDAKKVVHPCAQLAMHYLSARAHERKCRCTPPMNCLIGVSLATHRIWSQSAQPFEL